MSQRDPRRERLEFRIAFVIGLPMFLLLRWAVIKWTTVRPAGVVIFSAVSAAFLAWLGVNVVRRLKPSLFEPPRPNS